MKQTIREVAEYLSEGGPVRIWNKDGNRLSQADLRLLAKHLLNQHYIVRPS